MINTTTEQLEANQAVKTIPQIEPSDDYTSDQYEEVKRLRNEGKSKAKISIELGIDKRLVHIIFCDLEDEPVEEVVEMNDEDFYIKFKVKREYVLAVADLMEIGIDEIGELMKITGFSFEVVYKCKKLIYELQD